MESLCSLLFEVSNEDRLSILLQLKGGGMTVTGLSREIDLTTQEVSRHLSRLSETGLTEKSPEGLHGLTPYGELTLRQIRCLEFTSRHKNYFSDHTLARIPMEFVARLGELSGSIFLDDIMVVVHNVEKLLREAEEVILNINTPYIASTFPLIRGTFERGVEGRFIHGKDQAIPEAMMDDRNRVFDDDLVLQAKRSGVYKERLSEEADLVLYMSEKEVAILAFPLENGRYDFWGFTSSSDEARRWCRDLFQYYWEKAERI